MKTQKELIDVLDQLRDGYIETDGKGIITYVNQTIVEELGFENKEDIIGKYFGELVQREFLNGFSEQINTVLRNQVTENLSTRFRGKNGKSFIGEASISSRIDGGEIKGAKANIRNITQRLESEKEVAYQKDFLDALLYQAPVSIVIIDKEKHISHVNPAFQNLFGYVREEVIGKSLDELLATSGPLDETGDEYGINSGEPLHLSCQRRKKSGELTDVEVFVQPFFAGSVNYGRLVFYNDISERVKAQTELASINVFAEKISASLNLKEILNTIGNELLHLFPLSRVEIALMGNSKSQPEVITYLQPGFSKGAEEAYILDFNENRDVEKAMSTGRILISGKDPGSSNIMLVPLMVRGKILGLLAMDLEDKNSVFTGHHIQLAETLASQIATAVDNALLHADTEKALDVAERDLEIGREIQSGFFPQYLPGITGWELASYFKAARQVSGDFYDAFPLGKTGLYGIVVADVCDKGVGAALFMVLLRSLIRSGSEQFDKGTRIEDGISRLAMTVNRYIVENHGQSNMFATLVIAVLDPALNKLYYVNGGHDSPLWIDAEGHLKQELEPTGPAFGFSSEISFDFGVIEISPGDTLLFFTDGFSEARNMEGEFYTDERLLKEAAQPWTSALSTVKHFELDVYSHMGDQVQMDDLTMLALRRLGEKEIRSHRMIQKAELEVLPRIRNFVVEACLDFKLDIKLTESLKLAVDELCSNLILHGYKDMTPGNIRLTIRKMQDQVEVNIEDWGHPFDPALAGHPDLSDDIGERKIGGLGIFLVKELVDEMKYETGDEGNCVTIIIKDQKTEI